MIRQQQNDWPAGLSHTRKGYIKTARRTEICCGTRQLSFARPGCDSSSWRASERGQGCNKHISLAWTAGYILDICLSVSVWYAQMSRCPDIRRYPSSLPPSPIYNTTTHPTTHTQTHKTQPTRQHGQPLLLLPLCCDRQHGESTTYPFRLACSIPTVRPVGQIRDFNRAILNLN